MQQIVIGLGMLFAVLWGQGVSLAAEEEAAPVVQTEEVVTSATKTPVPVSHLTSAVEVITEEQMQRQKYKTVVDALRYAQGLTVFSNGGPGTEATVQIRGGSRSQTLVLIDGAIVNSATLGYYNFANLTTDNIEKVEILRGAQSMLWGADAMGGVINITTKKGKDTPNVGGFFEYGSFNSIREGGQVSGKKGPVDFSATFSRWDFGGFSAVDYRLGATERDPYRNWQASSRIGVDLPKDGRFEFNFRWMDGSTNIDNITSPARDVYGSTNRSNQFIFSGNYDQVITNWWNQKLTLSRSQDAAAFNPGTRQFNTVTKAFSAVTTTPNETRVQTNRLEWQHNFQVAEPLLVTAGYQFREAIGDSDTAFANRIIRSNAGFALAQLNLWDRVFGTAGIRQDSYNTFGDATTYRLTGGYLHKETDTKVRTSYGTGFRSPTINELFFPQFGNPNLKAEKSQSFDVGVDQWLFSKSLKLSGGYFWNRFANQIVNVVNSVPLCGTLSPAFLTCPVNIGNSVTKGWELGADYTKVMNMFLLQAFDMHFQYTYTMTRDLSNYSRIPKIPVDQWSWTMGYRPVEEVHMALTGRMMGSRFNTINDRDTIPGFVVWNLATTYDVTNQIQAYARAENIFNQHYQEILNAGTPVRSIYFGVKLNFDLFS